jgi:hypothetical protein
MKNFFLTLMCFVLFGNLLFAQDEKEGKGFAKENFYAGGSISAAIASGVFGIGANPEFGYSIAKWADIGIVGNFSYTSQRLSDPVTGQYSTVDKLRGTNYGGGLYTRLFPVKFLFAQAQIEHNWIAEKRFYSGGSTKDQISSNSFLVGAGYTTGRDPQGKSAYGYLAVLVDVLNNENSPYVTYDYDPTTGINHKRLLPVIRAGFIFPLFQGK